MTRIEVMAAIERGDVRAVWIEADNRLIEAVRQREEAESFFARGNSAYDDGLEAYRKAVNVWTCSLGMLVLSVCCAVAVITGGDGSALAEAAGLTVAAGFVINWLVTRRWCK